MEPYTVQGLAKIEGEMILQSYIVNCRWFMTNKAV